MTDLNSAPAVDAASRGFVRRLEPRAVNAIRAALRFWRLTPGTAIPDACFAELVAGGGLSDDEIDQLIADLEIVEAVTLITLPPDARRI